MVRPIVLVQTASLEAESGETQNLLSERIIGDHPASHSELKAMFGV